MGNDRHEIRVAGPAGDHVDVQVLFNARARGPAVAIGEPAASAFRGAFHMEPSELEAQVRKYTGRRVYHSFEYTFREPIETAERTPARTLSAASCWRGSGLPRGSRLRK